MHIRDKKNIEKKCISYFFFPAFPSFNLITSLAYLTPLPLYGSGGLHFLIEAANWPMLHLSYPLIMILVFSSTFTFRSFGIAILTGWENPRLNTKSLPSTVARYPTPTSWSLFSNPLDTPTTMLSVSVLNALKWTFHVSEEDINLDYSIHLLRLILMFWYSTLLSFTNIIHINMKRHNISNKMNCY